MMQRVSLGHSGGGLAYGYRVLREREKWGVIERGVRVIDETEARVIVRIFETFVAGKSLRAIAKELNELGIPSKNGRPWTESLIRGHGPRGSGILRNQIYIGRRIWNRQRFEKDPRTGRHVGRLNPPSEWVVVDVPELRIVPQDLWERAQARLEMTGRSKTEQGQREGKKPRGLGTRGRRRGERK